MTPSLDGDPRFEFSAARDVVSLGDVTVDGAWQATLDAHASPDPR
ncbi:MAG: hypothetical protein U0414_43390 [Polyangiaceae bacterium]